MAQHTITNTVASGNVQVAGTANQITGSGIAEFDDDVPSASDNAISIAFPIATLKSFVAMCTVDLVLEFNSSSSPTPSFSLKAGIPYTWRSDSGISNPFSVPVTSAFTTQSSGAVKRLKISALYDATP